MSVNVTCLNWALRLLLMVMESDSDIRFEVCSLDEAKNIMASGAYNACRTAALPVKLDNSAELFLGEKTGNQDLTMKVLDNQGQTIGLVSIAELDFKNRHCQVNFAFVEQNMPTIESVLRKIINHCTNKLNMNKIIILLLSDSNLEQTLNKTGFEREVTLKHHKYLDGAYHDVFWHSYFCDSDGIK